MGSNPHTTNSESTNFLTNIYCDFFLTAQTEKNRGENWVKQDSLFGGLIQWARYLANRKLILFIFQDYFLADKANAFLATDLLIKLSLFSNAGPTSSQIISCSSIGIVRKYSRIRSYL